MKREEGELAIFRVGVFIGPESVVEIRRVGLEDLLKSITRPKTFVIMTDVRPEAVLHILSLRVHEAMRS